MVDYILIGLIVGIVLILIAAIWFIIRSIKKRRTRERLVQEEVLADFDKAERMLAESGGELNPTEILWRVSQDRHDFNKSTREDKQNGRTNTKVLWQEPNSERRSESIGRREPETEADNSSARDSDDSYRSEGLQHIPNSTSTSDSGRPRQNQIRNKPTRFTPI